MQKEINYYTFADNDYEFLKINMKEGRVFNAMTSIAQNVCEGFLKHLIDCYCTDIDCTAALKTHSLKRMIRFLNDNLTDFEIDKTKVILADGYYFSARCPGDESCFANLEAV